LSAFCFWQASSFQPHVCIIGIGARSGKGKWKEEVRKLKPAGNKDNCKERIAGNLLCAHVSQILLELGAGLKL